MTQGIYKLVNNINNKVYIGQSTDIEDRFLSHTYALKNNNHHSYKLQNFYNDNLNTVFDYIVLEEVEREDYLLAREKHYIDIYDSCNNGFNVLDPKNYDSKNKKYTKLEDSKAEFNYLTNKYKHNLILSRKEYSYTFLYRINEGIKHFIKNYNLDLFVCKIAQYKYKVEFDVMGIYTPYYKKFKYDSNNNCVIVEQEVLKYTYKYKDIYLKQPLMSKFSDVEKYRRMYIWFIKQFYKSSDTMIQYMEDTDDSTYYFISYKTIIKYIGYCGDNFSKDILGGLNVQQAEKQFEVYHDSHNKSNKCIMIKKPYKLQLEAMRLKQQQ